MAHPFAPPALPTYRLLETPWPAEAAPADAHAPIEPLAARPGLAAGATFVLTRHGTLLYAAPRPGVLLVRLSGVATRELFAHGALGPHAHLAARPHVRLFADLELCTGMDVGFRVACARLLREHRARLSGVHLLCPSRRAAWGAGLVGAFAAGVCVTYLRRDAFEAAALGRGL